MRSPVRVVICLLACVAMPPALDCKEVDVWSAAKFQSAAQNGQIMARWLGSTGTGNADRIGFRAIAEKPIGRIIFSPARRERRARTR